MKIKFIVDTSKVKHRNAAARAMAEGRTSRCAVHKDKTRYTRKQKHKKRSTDY